MAGMIYLIGSLRNPKVAALGRELRSLGINAFDDWMAAGPTADDEWRDYEKARGRSYKEALKAPAALNVFNFDLRHLDASAAAVLVMPAGRSAHLELGYILGRGKPGFILFEEEPERYDVMCNFATAVCFSVEDLMEELKNANLAP